MGIPVTISHQGSLLGSPAASSVPAPSLSEILNTAFTATYQSEKSARPSVVNATTLSPYVVPFESIVRVRFLGVRVRSGHLLLMLTSPNGGVDQQLPVADLIVLHNPFSGDEFTAIKFVGTADIEYVIAGDTT